MAHLYRDLEIINAIHNFRRQEWIAQKVTEFDSLQLKDLPNLAEESNDGLTPNQRLAAGHLIAGQSISATALAIGVTRHTIHKWKRDPNFARVVTRSSQEALEAVATRARNLLLKSMRELERSLAGDIQFEQALRIIKCSKMWEMAKFKLEAEEEDVADAPDQK